MKLSIYTKIKNGLRFDYHIAYMLRHHARYVEEIVVNEGGSTDGTLAAIQNIDPKIKIIQSNWDFVARGDHCASPKNLARQQCTGDWCILVDADEFIPEWEFAKLRALLEQSKDDILPVRFLHFYGNYRVCQNQNGARSVPPIYGYRIHRNDPAITAWGDASNVRDVRSKWPPPPDHGVIEVHHFGEVRHPARLRQKWNIQAKRHGKGISWLRLPSWLFSMFPHRWLDPDSLSCLSVYEGEIMEIVRNNPDEFVRDGWRTLKYLNEVAQRRQLETKLANPGR